MICVVLPDGRGSFRIFDILFLLNTATESAVTQWRIRATLPRFLSLDQQEEEVACTRFLHAPFFTAS